MADLYSTTASGTEFQHQYRQETKKGIYSNSYSDLVNNFIYPESLAMNADERTRALYNDLYSPQAQMEQIKAAGLSPSIYANSGMAGKSGVSGAQGSGGSGHPATGDIFSAISNAAGAAMQIAQVKSQIELNKAQAKKLNEEAKTEAGENTRGSAEISNLLAQNGLTKASTEYTRAQTETQDWTNYITSNTADFSIRTAEYMSYKSAFEMEQTYWTAAREKQNYEFDKQTFNDRVQQEKETWINLQMDSLLKQKQQSLTDQQKELLKGELSMLYDESMRKWAEIDIKESSANAQNELIKKQVDNFERQLEQKDKELRIENRNSWFNNINNSIRTVAYSASCVASFIPMSGSAQLPPATLEASGVNQYY